MDSADRIARDFASFRLGLAAHSLSHPSKTDSYLVQRDSTCTSLYTYPDSSTTFDASSGPIKFTWDTACLPNATTVDLTLRAPQLYDPLIKVFTNVPFSSGSYSATLLPKWWNSTSSVQLQMTISQSNVPSFISSTVTGPAFEVTYPAAALSTTVAGGSTVAAAAADTSVPDSIVVSYHTKSSGALNAGSVFAAVFFPIVLVCTGIFLYVRMVRAKQAKKRQRWSQAIDNRMSVISQSWQPGATGPGTPRKSSALSNRTGRSADSTYGGNAPNLAGRGANAGYDFSGSPAEGEREEMSEVDPASFARPITSVFLSQERRSRVVSFAEDSGAGGARASVAGSIGGGASRAGGGPGGGAGGGGMRARPSVSIHGSSALGRAESDMGLSPEQEQGPWVLGDVSLDGAAIANANTSKDEDETEEMEEDDAYGGMSDMPAAKTINHLTYPTPTAYPIHSGPGPSQLLTQSFPSPPLSIPPKSYSPSTATPSPAPTAISSYFPAPPSQTGVDPNVLLQQHAAALAATSGPGSGSTAKRGSAAVRRPTVLAGGNNPFRASMAGELGDATP